MINRVTEDGKSGASRTEGGRKRREKDKMIHLLDSSEISDRGFLMFL